MLDRVSKEVLPAVKEATGVDLTGEVKIKMVTHREAAKVLEEEFKVLSLPRAKVIARHSARLMLAKYAWSTGEILLVADNFKWQAKAMNLPALNSEGVLRAVLTHECIHAVDDKLYTWSKTILGLSPESLTPYNAVIEGHAQLMAERICKAQGWEKEFAVYTSVIGKIAPEIGEVERLIIQVNLANLYAAYHDGAKFMAYLDDKFGKDGAAKAFANPPADFEAVIHPDWYLDPSKRPAQLYDFKPSLAEFTEGFDPKEWTARELVLSEPQIRGAMSLLPKETVDRVAKHLKQNKMLLIQDKVNPQARMIVAGLYEFDSPTEAKFYLAASEQLSKIKDAKMKEGPIKIVGVESLVLKEDGWQGLWVEKIVEANELQVLVTSTLGTRGAVAVELLYSNVEVDQEEAIAGAALLLERSFAVDAAKEPAKKSAEKSPDEPKVKKVKAPAGK